MRKTTGREAVGASEAAVEAGEEAADREEDEDISAPRADNTTECRAWPYCCNVVVKCSCTYFLQFFVSRPIFNLFV
jgi:hypothetical protein